MNTTSRNLELNHLTFSYQNKELFHNFSATFRTGEWSAIMAQSGAGKTTLLRLVAGLLRPEQGEIHYPWKHPKFSFVFQENRLLEQETTAKNLRLIHPNLSMEQLQNCLQKVGLSSDYLQKKIRKLSGGEQRRIAILRALLAEYDLLLLDEPFVGLDGDTKEQTIQYVKQQTRNKTVLLVTHNEEEVQRTACHHILNLTLT